MTDVDRARDVAGTSGSKSDEPGRTKKVQPHAGEGLPSVGPAGRDVDPVTVRNGALGRGSAALATGAWRLLLISAALVLIGYVIGKIFLVVFPLALALLLSTVLWPPVRFLREHRTPPALASLLVLTVGLGALGLVVAVLTPQVTGQAQDLADQVVAGLDDLQGLLAGPPFNLDDAQIGGAVDGLINELQANAQNLAGQVVTGVSVAGNLLVQLLLALVLTFFFLKDGPRFLPWVTSLVGPRGSPHVVTVAERSWSVLGAFIRAQTLVGVFDAVFIGLGLVFLDVPLALPLAVLVFFGAYIPIVGAFVSGALAALVALVTGGPTDALIVIGIVLVVQQLEGNVLQPMLVGKALDLHPALVLLAVTVGGTLAGITGAFLAVPVLSVAAVVVRYTRETLGDPRTVQAPSPPEVSSRRRRLRRSGPETEPTA